MFSIGKFSKLTGLSTKTLIWYDSIGLLKPKKINEENGYRYYSEESLDKVFEIKFLQSLDFSIESIINLSNEVIEQQINKLEKKQTHILMNIDFLKNLKEKNENMDKGKIFDLATKILNGKWRYQGSTQEFSEAQDMDVYYEKSRRRANMPNVLFFGETKGTDLNDIFYVYNNEFTLLDQKYKILLLNNFDTMILYQSQNNLPNEKIWFHVYSNAFSNIDYKAQDIENLYEKYKKELVAKFVPFNQVLIGTWEMVDIVKESEVNKYDGCVKNKKDAYFYLSPMFDKLEILDKDTVYTIPTGEEIKVGKREPFTRENSIMGICMDCTKNGAENYFNINNKLSNQVHKGFYKNIKAEDYLFVNLNNDPDLDEDLYVFKRGK